MFLSVKDACVLQDNALEIYVGDQVEHLDQLIQSEGNGEAFFAKTHVTQGMQTLIDAGIPRLAGKSKDAVFHLKQAMGGGKTHVLIAFGLLAKHPDLRDKVCPKVPWAHGFGAAQVAAFNGRNNPPQFFWGEVARQLGKENEFKSFWEGGPKAPDQDDWQELFRGDEPILILLDEMPPYFQYYETQQIGKGTIADIVTRAFANMLVAASNRKNVCVVVSDLEAAYEGGQKLIYKALEDARDEVGRQERPITPVDLASNEIYEILRKRLFKSWGEKAVIDEVATRYGEALSAAAKAKVASRGAEALADEIADTYPFHPRLKNVVALFKENEQFRQTRGLMELVSRLLKSVWTRKTNDVYLMGPQHFDLSIPEVRQKLAEISGLQGAIANDLWDSGKSAHAQVIDAEQGSDSAAQVGSLLLTASLSTAVNAVRGLSQDEMVEYLMTPLRQASEFTAAFEALEKRAWYLHHTPDSRYYFDKIENLTKLLQTRAIGAPEAQVEELIKKRLRELYAATRKSAYDDVLPLPTLAEAAEQVQKSRVLLILSPEGGWAEDRLQTLLEGLTRKNNLLVLSGDKTHLASLDRSARELFAAQKADALIPKSHPQREELERKQQQYHHDLTTTIRSLFDKVFFPRQAPGKPPSLYAKPLDQTWDAKKPFSGEEQVEKTLAADPLKLYLDIEKNFDAILDKAQDLLWPESQDEARWADVVDRMAEQAGMPWLPPKGLEQVRAIAFNRALWEDLGNGYVTRKPKKKKTSVQISVETQPDDTGKVMLRVTPTNAGPAPKVYYVQNGEDIGQGAPLDDTYLTTNSLRVTFVVKDPTETYETGDPYTWTNRLVIRNQLSEVGGKRTLKLMVAPQGSLRYTLDGSEPRDGIAYATPFAIGSGKVLVRVFAEAQGLEAREQFEYAPVGKAGPVIEPAKPATLATAKGMKTLDSRASTYEGITLAKEQGILFEKVILAVGQGNTSVSVSLGEIKASAAYIESILSAVLTQFDAHAPITMRFVSAHFGSGHDLEQFCAALGIKMEAGEVKQ